MGTTDHALEAVGASDHFQRSPRPFLAVDSGWVIRAVNQRYLEATGRHRDDLLGRYVFDAFPDNPADDTANGVRNLSASFTWVMRTGQPSYMLVQRYDVPRTGDSDDFVLKYWSPVNEPIRDDLSGRPVGVLHSVEDVTRLWAPLLGHDLPDSPGAESTPLLRVALRRNELAARQLTLEVDQLQEALTSRIVIEQAKGVLMAREEVAPAAAFEILREQARSARRSLREVAEEIVRSAHEDPAAGDPRTDG